MGKDFRFFVTPLKNESLSSFLKRNSELGGDRKVICGVSARVDGVRDKVSMGGFDYVYPYDGLLDNHTLLPMARKFSTSPRFISGPIAAAREWKVCWQCVISDCKEYGTPYYHRQHAAFGVSHCYRHDDLLVSECKVCKRPTAKHRISELHDCASKVGCDNFSRGSETQLQFVKYVHELITTEPEVQGFDGMHGFIRERLQKLGYGSNGEIDFKKIEMTLHLSLGVFYAQGKKVPPQISTLGTYLSNWSRITFLAFGTAESYISALKDANFKHSARRSKVAF